MADFERGQAPRNRGPVISRLNSRSGPVFPFPLAKFATALLPLAILGYIFGWMMSAISAGWIIHPGLILLDGVGILLALWRCKDAV